MKLTEAELNYLIIIIDEEIREFQGGSSDSFEGLLSNLNHLRDKLLGMWKNER